MPNYLTIEENHQRLSRARQLHNAAALTTGIIGLGLLWALRELILPVAIGMVLSYLCLPMIDYLKNRGLTRAGAILALFGIFCLLLFFTLNLAGSLIPDQKSEIELQIRLRYKLNEKFNALMGLNSAGTSGNWLYTTLGEDLEQLRGTVDKLLALSTEEQLLYNRLYQATVEAQQQTPTANKYWGYHQANQARGQANARPTHKANDGSSIVGSLFGQAQEGNRKSLLRMIFSAVSLWLVTPLVFLSLLFDDGRLKRGLIRQIPNRYFELTLTVIDNINSALGRYLRGTALESLLVGVSFTVCLLIIGFAPQWAIVIGAISGLANAIPFLGTAIGLAMGLLYATMAEEITPLLPFINSTNLPLALAASVFLVHLADNAIFQPYILGEAVDLHPLAIILGVMSGTLLFGFAGMLFAIPTIIVVKVVTTTTFRQLQAYQII